MTIALDGRIVAPHPNNGSAGLAASDVFSASGGVGGQGLFNLREIPGLPIGVSGPLVDELGATPVNWSSIFDLASESDYFTSSADFNGNANLSVQANGDVSTPYDGNNIIASAAQDGLPGSAVFRGKFTALGTRTTFDVGVEFVLGRYLPSNAFDGILLNPTSFRVFTHANQVGIQTVEVPLTLSAYGATVTDWTQSAGRFWPNIRIVNPSGATNTDGTNIRIHGIEFEVFPP